MQGQWFGVKQKNPNDSCGIKVGLGIGEEEENVTAIRMKDGDLIRTYCKILLMND